MGDWSVFCSSEMTLWQTLESFRMGAGHETEQAFIRSLELSAPSPNLREREGMEIKLINHAY